MTDSRYQITDSRKRGSRLASCLLLSAICYLPSPSQAASVQSGSAFLSMDTAARPAALAGAYTAVPGDADSASYNPAGLAALDHKELSFTHSEWLVDSHFDYLTYAQPTNIGTLDVSATRLDFGTLEGRDASRLQTANFNADDTAFSLGYAHAVGDNIGVGVSAKVIQEHIDNDRASSYAMDFGSVGRIPGKPLWLGASVLNIGPDTRFLDQSDPLPLTIALGTAYEYTRTLKLMLDVKHQPNDQTTNLKSGIEYAPLPALAVRAGYDLPLNSNADASKWNINNVRGGIGLKFWRLRVDYALVSFDNLGLTHWFTLTMSFGPTESELPKNLQPVQSHLLPSKIQDISMIGDNL